MDTEESASNNIIETAEHRQRFCPECGTPSDGTYCPNCGEQMETHLFSVKHYIKEIFHEFAVFDTKFFRTIPALLFKPGFLSVEYLAGRRKRYLAPARLYTLIAFFSFFALGYYLNQVVTRLYQNHIASNGQFQFDFGSAQGEKAYQLAETLLKFTIEVAPYVLLLGSTPIFALFLKLLYLKRRILFAEHLIFSFHIYAFSLIVLIGSIFIYPKYSFLVAVISFLIYLYIALKRFYGDRGFRLFLRLGALVVAYFGIALFAVVFTLLIASVIGYQLGEMPNSSPILKFNGPK